MRWIRHYRLAWTLALRELHGQRQGIGVMTACLFLGVFSISGIGSFSAAIQSGIGSDARSLLGGDLEISLSQRTLDPSQLEYLSAFGRVSKAIHLRVMPHHVESGSRLLAEVKAVDSHYPLFGQVATAPSLPLQDMLNFNNDGYYGAVADGELLRRLNACIGDILKIGTLKLRITAILEIEPDRNLSLFTLAPRLLISLEALENSGLLQPGSLSTYLYRLNIHSDQEASAVKTALQNAYPEAGWRVRSWQETEPRINRFIDRMTQFLTLTGLCALLAGGVGIGAAVRGYFYSRIRHLAILKSLGATSPLLVALSALQLLIMGGAGILTALAAGASLPFLIEHLAGDVFPLPIQKGFYAGPLLAAAWYGMLIIMLFSMIPLTNACRVSPVTLFRGGNSNTHSPLRCGTLVTIILLAAGLMATAVLTSPDRKLAFGFCVGAVACFVLFRITAWLIIQGTALLPRPKVATLRIALAAITRNRNTTTGIIFSLGLGMTALVLISQIHSNLYRLLAETLPTDAPSLFVLGIPDARTDEFDRLMARHPAVKRTTRQPALRGRITAIKGIPSDQAPIDPSVRWAVRGDRFISHAISPPEGSLIVKGQWWDPDDEGPPQVSITEDVATGFGVEPGDQLTINILGRELTAAIANFRRVDWSSLQLNFAIILNSAAMAGAPQTHLATLQADPDQEGALFDIIAAEFPDAVLIDTRAVLSNITRILRRVGTAFSAMAGIVLLTGFLVLAGTIAADRQQRLRDAVIFKVCGATRRDLLLAFGTEFALLGMLSALISIPIGSLAARAIITQLMNMNWQGDLPQVFLTLLPGLLLVILTGLAGTWRLLGQSPSPWLRNSA